jgi:hypothetical protein
MPYFHRQSFLHTRMNREYIHALFPELALIPFDAPDGTLQTGRAIDDLLRHITRSLQHAHATDLAWLTRRLDTVVQSSNPNKLNDLLLELLTTMQQDKVASMMPSVRLFHLRVCVESAKHVAAFADTSATLVAVTEGTNRFLSAIAVLLMDVIALHAQELILHTPESMMAIDVLDILAGVYIQTVGLVTVYYEEIFNGNDARHLASIWSDTSNAKRAYRASVRNVIRVAFQVWQQVEHSQFEEDKPRLLLYETIGRLLADSLIPYLDDSGDADALAAMQDVVLTKADAVRRQLAKVRDMGTITREMTNLRAVALTRKLLVPRSNDNFTRPTSKAEAPEEGSDTESAGELID